MVQINFSMIRNGYDMVNVTCGNYNSFEEAAMQISKEVNELANSQVGFFGSFQTKKDVNGFYLFSWTTDWNCIDDIIDNGCFAITADSANTIRWRLVFKTEEDVQGKEFCLRNF